MPQCPFCNAAVLVGQDICTTCDKYLPHPNEEEQFSPQFSLRVAPRQKIWHKCKTALLEIAGTSMARGPGFPILGIFIGTGLVIGAVLLVLPSNRSPKPSQLEVTPPPPAPSRQFPAATLVSSSAETTPSVPTSPVAQKPGVRPEPVKASPSKVAKPTSSPLMQVVNAHYLALRKGPTNSAPQIAALKRNHKVELLETSGGWGRVRDMRGNIAGWAYMRYLAPVGG